MILIKPDELKMNVCSFVHCKEEIPCPNQITSCLWSKVRVCDFNRIIDNTSTIEAEPVRHGRWIYTEYETGHAELQCSECGEGVYNKTKFCPDCGAKMDGGENG